MSSAPLVVLLASIVSVSPPDTLILRTGSPTGSYQAVGEAIALAIEDAVPGTTVVTEHSSGSVANMRALALGTADLAIVQNDIAYAAARGQGVFEGQPLRQADALVALHPEDILVIARRDLRLETAAGISPGHRIVAGEEGSGTLENAKDVFEALGLRLALMDTLSRSPRRSLHLLATDSADVIFLTAGVSEAFLQEVSENEGVIVSLGEELTRSLQERHSYYRAVSQEIDGTVVHTLRLRSLLMARADLPASLAEEVTHAIHSSIGEIRASHPRALGILPGTLAEQVPVRFHEGARLAYCELGVFPCKSMLPYAIALLALAGVLFASLGVSYRARQLFRRAMPRSAEGLVGPHGVTDRYRYLVIPVLVGVLLFSSALAIQVVEERFARENNLRSDFEDIGLNQNLVWMVVFTASGFEDGRFPRSPAGKLTSALMGWVGVGGVLLFVGMMTSDQIARKMKTKMSIDPRRLSGHTILCGWSERAVGLVRQLTDPDLAERRRTIVILTEAPRDEVDRFKLDPSHVVFMAGSPTRLQDLQDAGLDRAHSVIALADQALADPDARTILTVLQAERASYELYRKKERKTELRTVAELVHPDNRTALKHAHADLIVCPREFDEKLLVQSVLNPGLMQFVNEILTVDDYNEVYEVPVRGTEKLDPIGMTFDEALIAFRSRAILLLAINRAGAPGAVDDPKAIEIDEKTMRKMISNPIGDEECRYKIRQGDSLLFLAEDEKPLAEIFGASRTWGRAFQN